MAGVKGRSGRKKGHAGHARSWRFRNPANLAEHYLSNLIEKWLAANLGRRTVPKKIKKCLARFAIAETARMYGPAAQNLDVEQVLARVRRRAPMVTLRRTVRPRDEKAAERELAKAHEAFLDAVKDWPF
jgi:hypothetical protein